VLLARADRPFTFLSLKLVQKTWSSPNLPVIPNRCLGLKLVSTRKGNTMQKTIAGIGLTLPKLEDQVSSIDQDIRVAINTTPTYTLTVPCGMR
jgi:hypothetical protein